MLSITLDLKHRPALVVGGGNVAQRKIKALLQSDVRVRVIALNPQPENLKHDGLEWRQATYANEDLDGVAIVITAATSDVNEEVVRDAQRVGIPVSSATSPEQGDFHLPATIHREDLIISISTQGKAPALARRLRERLEADVDEGYGEWVRLLGELRPEILAKVPDAQARDAVWDLLCDPKWLELIRELPPDVVRNAMWQEITKRLPPP